MATPNMNLDLPIPNVTSGTWGGMLNTALTAVDLHNHTTGKGVLVPVAGIDASGAPGATTFLRGDGSWAAPYAGLPYDWHFSFEGVPSANGVLGRFIAVRSSFIPFNCVGSRGNVGVAPTAPATLLLKSNGVTVATVSVSILGVFSFVAGTITILAGDVLTLVAQNVPDATMANISLTFVGELFV